MNRATRLFYTAIFTVLLITVMGSAVLYISSFQNIIPPVVKSQPVFDPSIVYFFYGEECPHCHTVMPTVQNLIKKYPYVHFQVLETWHNTTNLGLSDMINKKLGVPNKGVPEIIVGNTILLGDKEIPEKLEGILRNLSGSRS